jgi:5-methylcytosine-specific restriction endonuclease McrA
VIKLVSQRYFLFAENHICVRCGLEGLYFAKERSAKMVKVPIEGTGRHSIEYKALNGERSSWHLNLYALKYLPNGDVREVLMTKDHILPKAKGGQDIMTNYQTMCSICNGHKADKLVVFLPRPINPLRRKRLPCWKSTATYPKRSHRR